jgi:transcriptional regulator with XRE-family HTH domain
MKRKGINQSALARRISSARAGLWRLLNVENEFPSLRSLARVVRALDATITFQLLNDRVRGSSLRRVTREDR